MIPDLTLDRLNSTRCAASFRTFVEQFWPCVSNDPFKPGYFVDAVCTHLQAVQTGELKRLAIACPIRHGKSVISSVMFPCWAWLHDPSLRLLTVSYASDLAQRDALRSRQLIQSPLYQRYFGHLFSLSEDQNVKSYYGNSRFGFRKSLGTHSSTTGADADYIICDDLLDYDKAKSEAERNSVLDYYQGTLSQRLAKGNGKDRIILVGHRVHEHDVFNNIYETFGNDGTWSYLVLPAEGPSPVTYFNGIGWKDTREENEVLCPERFGPNELEESKRTMRHKFHCLFNQNPAPQDGDLFKAEWFKYYTEGTTADGKEYYSLNAKQLYKSDAWRFATCDTAVSTKAGSDYTVIQIWDVIGDNLILADQFRKRLDGVRIVPYIHEVYQNYKPQFVSIETEFVGKFVIDQLRAVGVVVKPFKSQKYGDKETRAISAEIRCEAGRVWFPHNKSWVAELESELLSFPNGAHDDQTDAMSMGCLLADKYMGELKPEETPEQVQARIQKEQQDRFNRAINFNPYGFR